MNTSTDRRSKILLIASIYTIAVLILYLMQPKGIHLNYFIYFGFFIFTVYNIEAIIQLFQGSKKQRALLWIVMLYGMSLLGGFALFKKMDIFYLKQVAEWTNQVQKEMILRENIDLFKNIIKLILIWSRSFALLGLVKEFAIPKK